MEATTQYYTIRKLGTEGVRSALQHWERCLPLALLGATTRAGCQRKPHVLIVGPFPQHETERLEHAYVDRI